MTAVYTSLSRFEPSFADALSRWASVTTLDADGALVNGLPRYAIFRAHPAMPTTSSPAGRFSDQFVVWVLSELPEKLTPGTDVPVTLGVRALRPPEIAPSLFVHLYGSPTPYEGGAIWSQADSQLCTTYAPHLWRTSETIIQSFSLSVPEVLPDGAYEIAIGIYPFPDGTRLPVTAPQDNDHDYVTLTTVQITSPSQSRNLSQPHAQP